jgi:hypothetical protein
MRARGFSIDFMVELVRAGLAAATSERVVAGTNTIEVARLTDSQRQGGKCSTLNDPTHPQARGRQVARQINGAITITTYSKVAS